MTESPSVQARIAGVLYLLCVVTSIPMLFAERLVVSTDAAATATNILAHESFFRLCLASNIIATVCYVAVTALFYGLFKPVNRNLSLVAAFFGLAGCTVAGLSIAFQLASIGLFKGAQTQALALTFLKLNGQGANIAFVFFGLYCVSIGYLIFKSTFLPRILSVLMATAGACWLLSSFANILSPPFAKLLFPYILAGGLGELAVTVWLLVMGVHVQRWNAQAAAA